MDPTPQQNPPHQATEEEPIDLRKYWAILLKRKWVVLLVFVLCVGVTAVFTLRQKKIYSSTCSLVIDAQMPQVLGSEVRDVVDVGGGSYWYNKEFYETQYRVLRSRSIAERVVGQLGLSHDLAFLGIDRLPPEKRAEALEKADAVELLQKRLFIEPVKDSRVVNVRVEDPDPQRAAQLANAIADAYMRANLERRVDGSKSAADWLQDQLADLKTKLSESELALFTFKKDNDLIYTTLENKQSITSQKLVAINDTLTKIRTRKAELDAKVRSINSAKKSGDLAKVMQLGIIASNAFINDLKKSFLTASNEVADLAERYGPEHPKMKASQEKLDNARQTLQTEIDSIVAASLAEYDDLVQTEKNLEEMLEGVKREAFENNKKEIDFNRLAREEQNNQRLYDLVLKRMKELDLSSLLNTNNIRVLDAAKVSQLPIKPQVRMNLMLAMMLGLIAGFGLAFLLELQDRTIKSHQDIEALGVSFLGLIPSIPGDSGAPAAARDQYVLRQPKSSVAECCRTVRTNLLFSSPDNPPKRLVVTSASPQEGKTTTLVNLGITLANAGGRVLLVDTDMRRPRLHKSFGLANDLGLSSLIVGEGKLEDAIRSTNVPGLFILPSGPVPPNPAELLHADRFKQLSRRLGDEYGHVLFDSPPVGAVTDPLLLANQMDGTIVVVKMFKTNRDAAENALKSLGDANARIVGVVLNDVAIEKREYGYYQGYYSYGGYYGEGEKRADGGANGATGVA